MNSYRFNQSSNVFSQGSIGSVEQKAAQLKQSQDQLAFQNVQKYVQSAQQNNFSDSVEQKAKQLETQDAKNYIQQMNSKLGMQ